MSGTLVVTLVVLTMAAALGVMGEGPLRSETLRPLESCPYIIIVADRTTRPTTTPILSKHLHSVCQYISLSGAGNGRRFGSQGIDGWTPGRWST